MKPVYLQSGDHTVAGIFQSATAPAMDTAVLLVPPFGWDDQTTYRPRRDWSLSLAASGFASLRIDLPGTGDSSGTARDHRLVEAWTAAVSAGVGWLRGAGARRVAVIALGAGGLLTLRAMALGAVVDDLVLWGVPATGRALVREIRAFGRLEQFQTGQPAEDITDRELWAGGHLLTADTVAALSAMDAASLIGTGHPTRALVLGRDGAGPDRALADALRATGCEVRTDPGDGWGAAVALPQATAPAAVFKMVDDWLGERAAPGEDLILRDSRDFAEFTVGCARVRERALAFDGAGQRLYAVIAEPVDAPVADGAVILFNAGAIRRIGPNRMWTEAARRWAAAGVPVIRLDVEGIGDAGGENTAYIAGDESFYVPSLTAQARAALDFAVEQRLPERFVLAGLCSGAFWAFEAAVADPRVEAAVMLNPRLLAFDPQADARRELRKLGRLFTRKGIERVLREERKLHRASKFAAYLLKAPLRMFRRFERQPSDAVSDAFRSLNARGQRVHIAFSGEEPLHEELRQQGKIDQLQALGVTFHTLPYTSHTLKPAKAQQAANAILDRVVEQTFPATESNVYPWPKGARALG